MNAQKTIIVRRANNNVAGVGKHCTLTNVRNNLEGQFGFAMTDEGEEVYVPALVVRNQQMTEADIGAGFTCPLKTNPRANDQTGSAPWVATNPIKWDDENPETVTVALDNEPEIDPVSNADWDKLIAAGAELVDHIGPADDLVIFAEKLVKGAQHLQTKAIAQRDALKKFQRCLDEIAPENEG